MSPTIEVDDAVYAALERQAHPFVDKSPNDVLKRLLQIGTASPGNPASTINPASIIYDAVREAIEADPQMELLTETTKTYIHFAPKTWTAPALMKGTRKSGRILSFMVMNRPPTVALSLEIQPGDQSVRGQIWHELRDKPWFTGRGQQTLTYSRIFRKSLGTIDEFKARRTDARWLTEKIRNGFADFKSKQFPAIDSAVRGISF